MRLPFDGIFVINLSRRQDRWRAFTQRVAPFDLTFERFDGVDGHALQSSQLPVRWEQDGCVLNKGMLGCFLSHRQVLAEAFERGYDKTLILEDDVVFVENFESRFRDLWLRTPSDWDMLYLARSNWDENGVYSETRGLSPLIQHRTVVDGVWRADMNGAAFSYAVRLKCLSFLLDNLKTIRRPVDEQYARLHASLITYAYYPALVHHAGDTPSDIWETDDFTGASPS